MKLKINEQRKAKYYTVYKHICILNKGEKIWTNYY